MIKTLKLLQKYNGLNLNQRQLKSKILEIKRDFKVFNIEIKIKTECDYFEALIKHEALKNKQKFEKLYENERHQLLDIWDNLSYQERNKLIQLKLDEIKESCHFFKTDENKVIWIPFFDTLLNGLYHNDIAIFELQQYYKLYKDFKDRQIDIRDYGFLPYTSSFIDVHVISSQKNRIVFYYQPLASLFECDAQFNLTRIALDKDACKVTPLAKDLLSIVKAYQTNDLKTFSEACLASILISDKAKKIIQKRLGKLS